MIRRTLILLIGALECASGAVCGTVASDRILGRDLKALRPGYANVPDDTLVALSPSPGLERRLTRRELSRFGEGEGDVCFVRAASPLSVQAVESAMRAAFAGRAISLEVIDYSRNPLPVGSLEFPVAGLLRPSLSRPDAPVLWRGRVRFEGARSALIWATVRIGEQRSWPESAEMLKPGRAVRAEDIVTRSGSRFPLVAGESLDPRAIIGMRPRRTIPGGAILSSSMFEEAPLIAKGEIVTVEVASGPVRLSFSGRAEIEGRINQSIIVFDPAQGKRWKARVIEKGRALIDVKQAANADASRVDGRRAGLGSE